MSAKGAYTAVFVTGREVRDDIDPDLMPEPAFDWWEDATVEIDSGWPTGDRLPDEPLLAEVDAAGLEAAFNVAFR